MIRASAQMMTLWLVPLLCCCGPSAAVAGRAESISHSSNQRKLLSCMAEQDPRYQADDGAVLPLCATQYMINNNGGPGQYTRVTPGSTEPLSKANAADLAHAWSKDPLNPQTNSQLQCTGQVDVTPRQCWSGRKLEVDATFVTLSCCSTSITCYIKSGGCVMH